MTNANASLRFIRAASLVVAAGLAGLAAAPACDEYEPPPTVRIEGLESGVLGDPRAPLVLDFGVPVDLGTVRVKVALFDTDVEGNLKDEDSDPDSQLDVLLQRDPDEGDVNVVAELEPDGARLRLTPQASLPVGPKLVLLLESGAKSTSGNETRYRQRVPFSYAVKCAAGQPTRLASGVYFALLEVAEPLGTQIQLYGAIDVDPQTGALVGQFTNADRNAAQTCPTPCPSTDACRLLPLPECVPPSTRAGTFDEYPDFVPNVTPPTGYSFLVQGCAVDDGEATGVVTAPATMVVESPKVTVEGLAMTAQFVPNADGVVRATGSLTADTVRLGTNPLGAGKGTMTAIRIPDDRVPPGVPRPTARAAGADGGADGGS